MPLIIINEISWNMTEWVRRRWKSMPTINWDLKRIFLVWVMFYDKVLHTVSTSTDSLEYWISVWMILSISSIRCRNDEGKIRLINFAIYIEFRMTRCARNYRWFECSKVDTDYRAIKFRLEKSLLQLVLGKLLDSNIENGTSAPCSFSSTHSKSRSETIIFAFNTAGLSSINNNKRVPNVPGISWNIAEYRVYPSWSTLEYESTSHSHYNPTVVHYTYLFVHLLFMRKSEYAFKFNYKV